MNKYLAEFVGTFVLVFSGTGAIVLNDALEGAVGNLGIALAFGISVSAMICVFKNISGAHINPAVSIAFSFTDRFEKKYLVAYLIAQLLGAFTASFILLFLYTEHPNLGATIPFISLELTFILEFFLTFFLMFGVLFISQNKSFHSYTALGVGTIVFLEAYFAGPLTGASMNPARSISPAIISGNISHLWIYIAAPISGAIFASLIWKKFCRDAD